MKTITKRLSLLLSLFLIVVIIGCHDNSDEIISEKTEISTNTFFTKRISIDKRPQLVSYLDKYSEDGIISKNGENTTIFNFDDILEVIDTLGNTNYSINFSMPDTPYNVMYNLVVGTDSLGQQTNPIILKFISLEDSYKTWADHQFDFGHFTGELEVHNFTAFFGDNEASKLIASKNDCIQFDPQGDPIPCNSTSIDHGSPSSGGGTSSSGSGNTSGSGVVTAPDDQGSGCTIRTYWRACGGSNQYVAHTASSCGGDGHGAGWVIYINCGANGGGSYHNPTDYNKTSAKGGDDCTGCNSSLSGGVGVNSYASNRINILVDNLDADIGLTPSQKAFLKDTDNHDVADEILTFWRDSDRSEETKVFIKKAINTLRNEDEELAELNTFILTLNLFQDTKITFDLLLENFENIKNSHFDKATDKPIFSNYCAINLSHALLKSGVTINSQKVTKCWGCIDKNYNNKHAIRAEELANWLSISKINGIKKVKKLNGSNFRNYVSGKKGIIFFKDYWQRNSDTGDNRTGDHIDIWTGNGLASENFFSAWFRLAFPEITESVFGISSLFKSKEVFFWEIETD